MLEELKVVAVVLIVILVLSFAVVGVAMLNLATGDTVVIDHCEKQGWHNFGQTRIVCMVEPKKEAK